MLTTGLLLSLVSGALLQTGVLFVAGEIGVSTAAAMKGLTIYKWTKRARTVAKFLPKGSAPPQMQTLVAKGHEAITHLDHPVWLQVGKKPKE